ncbi:uncharacterized protein LOC128259048 isoform X5 [Drosophila gunungcola]|nr:uncharacterized protein LOC128259048 isoform X5 [Drosophila gunungcola]
MSKCIRPQCNFSYLAGASITFCFISQQLLKLNWFLMISILTIRMALSQAVGILGVTQSLPLWHANRGACCDVEDPATPLLVLVAG